MSLLEKVKTPSLRLVTDKEKGESVVNLLVKAAKERLGIICFGTKFATTLGVDTALTAFPDSSLP